MPTTAQVRTLAFQRPLNPNLRGRSLPVRRDNETVGDSLRNFRNMRLELEEWFRQYDSSSNSPLPPREYR